jgi:pyrroline-5-carboxylate reductase
VTIALLGGGKMGLALVGGWLDAGYEPDELVVAESDPDRRRDIEAAHPGVRVVPSAAWAVPDAEAVVLAVKPGDVAEVLDAALPALGAHTLVLSIAAGVRLTVLEGLAPGRPVVRAMPNTPALVRQGAAAIAGGLHADAPDLDLAERLLGAVGSVVRVPESLLDAVTGLSGSGPAYVFLVAEALIEAGVLAGLPRDVSAGLTIDTLLGAATLLAAERDPERLRAMVTSPGGTTAAGLRELERSGVRAAFLDAVTAATARSRELGT